MKCPNCGANTNQNECPKCGAFVQTGHTSAESVLSSPISVKQNQPKKIVKSSIDYDKAHKKARKRGDTFYRKAVLGYIGFFVFFITIFFVHTYLYNIAPSEEGNFAHTEVIDLTEMTYPEISKWADSRLIDIYLKYEYSDSIPSGTIISQSEEVGEVIPRGTLITIVMSNGPAPAP